PEVVSDGPGKCPKCNMALKPVASGAADAAAPAPAGHDHGSGVAAAPSAASPASAGHDHSAHAAATTAPSAGMKHSCPHHPEVVSDQPGKCPKCNMALKPVANDGAAPAGHDHGAPAAAAPAATTPPAAHDHSSHGAAASAAPTTAPAVKYTCPHHPEVVSDVPGKCPKCGMTLKPMAPAATKPAAPAGCCGGGESGGHDHGAKAGGAQ
ncbi:MAG TPA: heavy metal-binding domain-containing protein, partial [Humisphaera sp.]